MKEKIARFNVKVMKSKTLIIYNWDGVKCNTKFPISDIKKIHVCKYSGDEVVEITNAKGETHKYDSAVIAKDPRAMSYYDGSFDLDNEEDIQNWINDESRNIRVAEWYKKNIKKEKSAKKGKCSR